MRTQRQNDAVKRNWDICRLRMMAGIVSTLPFTETQRNTIKFYIICSEDEIKRLYKLKYPDSK